MTKDEVYDNEAFAIFVSMVATTSTAYLYGRSILSSMEGTYKTIVNKCTGRSKKSLGRRVHPILNPALKAEEAITNILGLAPTWVIWGDFFDEPKWEHYLMRSVMCVTIYLVLQTSSAGTIDEICEAFPGSEEGTRLQSIAGNFVEAVDPRAKAPEIDIARFISRLAHEEQQAICNESGVSYSDLQNAIQGILRR